MKCCFAGDLFLGGDLLKGSCLDAIECDLFNNADIRVVNLEQSVSDNSYVEDKCTLYTGSSAIEKLKEMRVDAVNLAHNHIQDKGLDGIRETVSSLLSHGVDSFGAGANINEAGRPFWIDENIAILGYCDFERPYLMQVEVASSVKPGINPLRFEKIISDLQSLPAGKKAILYFHWGMEHVWLPPSQDIELAKKLLENDRVIGIVGMHSHRVQGVLSHAGKNAYMCLGNFLFPNFYIAPPVQIRYPSDLEKDAVSFITRQYHAVERLTYKKWRWVNRVSIVLSFCTETLRFSPKFVLQDDDLPKVRELKGVGLLFYDFWFFVLSLLYRLPSPAYEALRWINVFCMRFTWRLNNGLFYLRQLGLKDFLRKVLRYAEKKSP